MLDLNLFKMNEEVGIEIEEVSQRDIAVIGMAVRMPMADTLEEFWENIRSGRNCIIDFPHSRRMDTESYIKCKGLYDKSGRYNKGAYLEDIDKFDFKFFQISPNEAKLMDPNQRQFLQVAWKAIEDSGYGGGKLSNTRTGVYLGYNADAPFTYKNFLSDMEPSLLPIALSGNLTSIIAGRISYLLDLKGPSLAVDTACSSSLIAVHLACRAIRNDECDMALAGGVKLDLLPLEREFKLGIESSDGRTKTFDDSSDGTGMGEGTAAVLLKPLSKAVKDGDYIYAVIKGSASNQDGRTIGITAPNVVAQEQVIMEAWRDSGIDPETVTYIETHGTGTKLGDPIEVDGISRAFSKHTSKKQFCAVGSLKTNIGHLDNSAGIAGFVKAALSLKKREIAPTLNFKRPNSNISFFDSPVYVNDRLSKWEADGIPLRCGVSAFGLSGTNCHIVLEEAPPSEDKACEKGIGLQIFTLSAKSREALTGLIEKYRGLLRNNYSEDINSICYTANTGRGHYNFRIAVLAKDTEDLAGKLVKVNLSDLASKNYEIDGIFYGEQKISNVGRETKVEGLMDGGTGAISNEAYALVKEIGSNSDNNKEKLTTLCSLYIKGASINWEELYQNQKLRKLPLPTYIFDKKRCWVKMPKPTGIADIEYFNRLISERKVSQALLKKMKLAFENWKKQLGIETVVYNDDLKEEMEINLLGRSNCEYSNTENWVAAAWATTMGFDEIDVTGNFYDFGGDSIIAMKIANILNENSKIQVEITDVLKHLTIEDYSKYYDERLLAEGNTKQTGTIIPCAQDMEFYPISSSQRRMYIINQADGEDLSCNIPGVFIIEGRLDRGRLEECFNELLKRHQALRTSFEVVDGEIVQKINSNTELEIEHFTVKNSDIDKVISTFVRPFNVEKAPLIRLGLADMSDGRSLLLLDMHHIISDGVSADILIREFSQLYTGEKLLEPRLQYKDFSVWQNEFVKSDYVRVQGEYWKGIFSEGVPLLEMPLDYARPSEKAYEGGKISISIGKDTVQKLKKLAGGHNVTLNSLFISMYALLLNKYTGQRTVTVGTIVSGRHHRDLENIIGIFINYLPICCRVNEDYSFSEFLLNINTNILNAYKNQDYPYDKLVEDLNINSDATRNPLFDTMLVYHNEFQANMAIEIGDAVFKKYETEFISSTLDLKLDIIEIKDGTLKCRMEYNSLLFKKDTMNRLLGCFQRIIRYVSDEPEKCIDEFELLPDEEKRFVRKQIPTVNLAVSATFTVEPIEDYIKWWCSEFGLNTQASFAPYNQVFQELLDPDGIISSNSGVNLLLIRFEDWIRNDVSGEEILYKKLEKNLEELVKVLKDKPKKCSYLVGVFPISKHLGFSKEMADFLEGLTVRWKHELAGMQNVFITDFTQLAELYNIVEVFDPVKDREGHMPFSDEFYAAMGTEIARKICALRKQQFKVIVLDCDNTLWKGICGEDGALGITVPDSFAALQRFMLQKHDEGMLLALCSKNNEADVWEVFEKNSQMLLKREHIAAWRINWNTKHDNIKELAKDLNLGLDSFIFIDDNPMECSGMMLGCPEVLTLQLPTDTGAIPLFLAHVWAFDRPKVTEEDTKRTGMYIAERNRQELKHDAQSLMDFISGLELKIGMDYLSEDQISRASQLTQRTNQFNLSTIRRSEEELIDLVKKDGYKCWTIQAMDRFGDYGLTGLLITVETGKKLVIDTFLLSCRVLGRGVEDAVLAVLGEHCRSNGINLLEADYHPNAKNKPILDFLRKSGWIEESVTSEYTRYTLSTDKIASFPAYIERFSTFDSESYAAAAREVSQYNLPEASDCRKVSERSGQNSHNWVISLENEDLLLHKCQYLPIVNSSASKLLKLAVCNNTSTGIEKTEYIPPENDTQRRLAEIWSDILKLDCVGVDDNFFKAGGHSLKAANLVSRIHREFNVDISMRDIFSNPTVRGQAKRITNSRNADSISLQCVEKRESYAVSSVQKRLYILSQLDGLGTSYNNTVAFHINGNLDRGHLQNAFVELIKRHEALRTSFELKGGEPVQKINDDFDFHISCIEAEQNQIDTRIREMIKPFDLSRAPLIRAELVKLSDRRHVLVLDMHHIVSDGMSIAVLIGELTALYSGKRLPEIKMQYKDFSQWQSSFFKTEQYKLYGKYWTDLFADGVPLLNMPKDYPRPAVQHFEGSRLFFGAGEALSERLRAIAAQAGATNYMLLLAAYNVLLMKYSAQEDIVVGSPVAGRPLAELEGLIGMFVNTVIIKNKPSSDKNFTEFLEEVKENTIQAFENQDYQFADLVEKLDFERETNRNPLYDVAFVLLNMDVRPIEMEGIEFTPYSFETGVSKVDLTLIATERDNNIYFELEYSTNLFKPETVERIKNSYLKILEIVAGNMQVKLRDIELEQYDYTEMGNLVESVEFNF